MQHIIALITLITALATPSPHQFAKSGDISDEMIPEGWEFVGSAMGDLNGDGRADMIVVARPDEKPLAAVYWDNGNGQWELVKEYNNAFRSFDQMPYTPEFLIEITEQGDLKIELYDPEQFDFSISSSYMFRSKDGEFILEKEERESGDNHISADGSSLKLGDFEID